jgi:hypothetical protein
MRSRSIAGLVLQRRNKYVTTACNDQTHTPAAERTELSSGAVDFALVADVFAICFDDLFDSGIKCQLLRHEANA